MRRIYSSPPALNCPLCNNSSYSVYSGFDYEYGTAKQCTICNCIVMRFMTDPTTTVILDYKKLVATVRVPTHWHDTPIHRSRPMILEDLDPAKWMRKARIANTQYRARITDVESRLETFLSSY